MRTHSVNRFVALCVLTVLMAFMNATPARISAAGTASISISEVHPSGSGNGTYNTTLPLPIVSTLSTAGVNGAFLSANGAETGSPGRPMNASPLTGLDLSNYIRIGRFDLPEPTRTTPPADSLLAQEVSAVTYNWDTDTLFVVGDGGTAVVQVTKTGELIDSMTLARGGSPQGTEFYDPEGITYVGNGKFVMVEERDRQAVLFTYAAGTTLTRPQTQTVKLGTFVDNIGLEGLSYDPRTGGFIFVKETQPEGIFQTLIDFAAGTASNGSPTTENSVNLFPFTPPFAGLLDFADVFALSNLQSLTGPDSSHLLILSQESGKILHIDRSGTVYNSLTIRSDPGNPLSVAEQQHEGLTMDGNGFLYVVSENGGGDFNHPQLWVYAPSTVPNQAPTALTLTNRVDSIPENTNTAARVKVADVVITDDELGTNNLTVTGGDSDAFEVDSTGLYIKAGINLDFETKSSYSVTVAVDDPTVGTTPDATASFNLTVTDVVEEPPTQGSLAITEVAPWSSGNSPVGADWFEVTNVGGAAVDITGWRMDDNSNSFANSVPLNGVTSIGPGKSVIFIETSDLATAAATFRNTWFGANLPPNLQIGSYSGGGVGLSTGGDAVNLFDATGALQASVNFGASPASAPFATFDNSAGLNNATISLLSAVGVHGASAAVNDANEIGSPGTVGALGKLIVSEVSPWSSGNSPYAADWFEVTNTGALPVDLAGWRVDDNSNDFGAAVPLRGVASIPPGKSAVFIEGAADGSTDAILRASFATAWAGSPTLPAGFLVGFYGGSGVGLSTGGDGVNLFDSAGNRVTGVSFGASTTGFTFDNAAGLGATSLPLPTISTLSIAGVNGAFLAADGVETGSPWTIGGDTGDRDGDGIADGVDPLPLNASNETFSDAIAPLNGTTTGTILTRGGKTIAIVDATPNPATGVQIDVSGMGSGPLQIQLGGKVATISLANGTYTVTDPAATSTVAVTAGGPAQIAAMFNGFPILIVVGGGSSVTYTEMSDASGKLTGFAIDAVTGSVTLNGDAISSPTTLLGPPLSADACKKGGWQTFNFPVSFKNQGDCVSYVNAASKPPK
jgi:uncharacterized protein YjiK